jgi:hypothetical protein
VVCDTPEATSATAFRCVQLFPFVPSFGPAVHKRSEALPESFLLLINLQNRDYDYMDTNFWTLSAGPPSPRAYISSSLSTTRLAVRASTTRSCSRSNTNPRRSSFLASYMAMDEYEHDSFFNESGWGIMNERCNLAINAPSS